MTGLPPTDRPGSAFRLRLFVCFVVQAFLVVCLPRAVAQCDAPFCGTIDAQQAISTPQTITFNGTNLPGAGGQVLCLSAIGVNNGGNTGVGNDSEFTLNILNADANFYKTYNSRLTLDMTWTPASGDASTSDLELLFDSFDNQSDNSGPHEQLVIDNVGFGSHTVLVCDQVVTVAQPYTITAKLEVRPVSNPSPQPMLPPAPLANVTAPRYQNHTPAFEQVASGMGKNSSDEPSIG